jgi:DNA polymerase-1
MEKIFIIDAVNFLFRSYYAIGPMTNDQGQSTSALYGFIRSIQKMQNDFSFSHMAVVFDGPDNKKSRLEVYADYKMHRKGAPEDLYPQFNLAFEYCKKAGLFAISVPGVEADDTIATIALWAEKQGMEVFICSSDKDLYQLVNDHIHVLNVHKENLLVDREKVKELLGVYPEQVLDYLSIMGDASDNIPGLEGFGPKTAAALLDQFGTLENLLDHPEQVKGDKKQQIIREQRDKAIMSKKLASLDSTITIPHDIDAYKIKETNVEELKEFYHSMRFFKFLQNLGEKPASAPPPVEQVEEKKSESIEVYSYTVIKEEKALIELIQKLQNKKAIAIDTETTSIKPIEAKVVGIGFCYEKGVAYYVPLNGPLKRDWVLEQLKPLIENPKIEWIGHNIKYDLHTLKNENLHLKKIGFDTLIASYLLNPQHRRHNLDALSLEYFNKTKITFDSLVKEDKKTIPIEEVPLEKIGEYCCEDVDYTFRLKEIFEISLNQHELTTLFQTIEMPLIPVLAKMERDGIYVDVSDLEEMKKGLVYEIAKIEKEIYADVGQEFNINSPKQLSDILYVNLNLPRPRKQATGYSTGADVLEKLSSLSPVVEKILEYRGLQKLFSTYVDSLPQQINPHTGRIHASFQQSVTATGRLSCQDPNLQNIPLHSEGGRKIRQAFKPQKEGWSYLSSDYSQIELRLLAHFSQDPQLLHAFKTGQDIHAHTASLIYNLPIEMISKEMRQAAKTVNFGILYGQGPYGLSQQLKISLKEADDFIRIYFERYKNVKPFLEDCKQKAEKLGYAITLMGRKRPIPEIHNQNAMIRQAAYRLAINTPLQGTGADIIKMAMIAIDHEIQAKKLQGKMILQIHDELLFEIPDSEIEIFQKLVKNKMEKQVQLQIPLLVDIQVGKNWGEC